MSFELFAKPAATGVALRSSSPITRRTSSFDLVACQALPDGTAVDPTGTTKMSAETGNAFWQRPTAAPTCSY